jgi:hypothetical protein
MKHLFISITVVLLVFSAIELNAQTNEIDFTLTSKSVNISGQNVAITSTFNKTGNALIWTLLTNQNTDVNNFIITNTTGNWNQDSSIGELTYSLVKDDQQAKLHLLGQDTGISATFIFNKNDTEQAIYIFNIETFSYQ